MRPLLAILVLAAAALLALPAAAKDPPTCKTPRDAVESAFASQAGREPDLARASACFDPAGRTPEQLHETARRLKTVFDAEGAAVDPAKVSDDPDYLDDDKNPRLAPSASLPRAFVEKQGGRWVWPRASLDWIDRRYRERLGWVDALREWLPAPLERTAFGVALWQYAALLALAVLGVFVSRLLHALLKARVRRLGGESWRHRVVDAVAAPVAMLVTAGGLQLLYPELRLPLGVAATLHRIVRLLVTFALVWAAYRGADVLAARLAERADKTHSKLDDQLVPIVRKAIKFGVFVIGAIALAQNMGVDVTALFATLGIGTLAIGLAAKDTLANLFGSVSIFVDNPFKIGDWINVEGVDGVVEEVGFRSTRLRTFYDSLVVIPNAKVADSKIDNYGQRRVRRAQFSLRLALDTPPDKVDALCDRLRALLGDNPRVRDGKADVWLGAVGDGLEVQATFFLAAEPGLDEAREKHGILLASLRLCRELGVALVARLTVPAPGGS